jgi:hypothetical protein
MADWRHLVRARNSVHADRDFAHKSKACYTGPCQGISGYSATTRSLGQITCGPKRFELQFVPGFPVRRSDRRSLEKIFQIVIVISV